MFSAAFLRTLAASACVALTAPVSAQTVFSVFSTGPIVGLTGWNMSAYSISEQFSVARDVRLTGLLFGALVPSDAVLSSVSYSIGAAPFGAELEAGRTDDVMTTFHSVWGSSHSFYDVSLALPHTFLEVGTYYLTLNATSTSSAYAVFWDSIPNTLGRGVSFIRDTGTDIDRTTFTTFGTPGVPIDPVPEPGTYAPMLAGILGIGVMRLRRR